MGNLKKPTDDKNNNSEVLLTLKFSILRLEQQNERRAGPLSVSVTRFAEIPPLWPF